MFSIHKEYDYDGAVSTPLLAAVKPRRPPPIKPPFGPDLVFAGKPNTVFVFGSNLAGAHGGGAAAVAFKKYGAVMGQGFGFQSPLGAHGTVSYTRAGSYALPTKDHKLRTLTITEVAFWVKEFFEWASNNGPTRVDEIFVTKVGCGLAGYTEQEIAPLFRQYAWQLNVVLPTGWGN